MKKTDRCFSMLNEIRTFLSISEFCYQNIDLFCFFSFDRTMMEYDNEIYIHMDEYLNEEL